MDFLFFFFLLRVYKIGNYLAQRKDIRERKTNINRVVTFDEYEYSMLMGINNLLQNFLYSKSNFIFILYFQCMRLSMDDLQIMACEGSFKSSIDEIFRDLEYEKNIQRRICDRSLIVSF